MRQARLLLLLVGAGLGVPAVSAQAPRVNLSVRLAPDSMPNGARRPWIQVRNLIPDPTWSEALDKAFPVRLEFRVEIWRGRDGWIDDFQRATEWNVVIQREPLQDVYRVTRILLSGPEEFRFATRDELDAWIRQVNQIDVVPRGSGSFYYNVTLRISALSDEDMEELERFLSGDPNAPKHQTSPFIRALRGFFLRMAGLPQQTLEARSDRFVVH
jgi:hypothetical protein